MDSIEKRKVTGFMDAIENGSVSAYDACLMLKDVDPLLTYFPLRYLKEKYPLKQDGHAAGKRLLEVLTTPDGTKLMASIPKKDPLIDWFDDTYTTREFFNKPREFVDLIIDKLEG